MDWGAYVIIAAVWLNGQTAAYHPSTLFDREACIKQAAQINADWRAQDVHGIATCKKTDD